jgi:hypothetical protein
MKLLSKLFGPPEEINGGNRCPTYLYRWTIAKFWGKRGVYLHHFVGDDWSLDLHDHPKRFISIGLRGWYVEERPCPRRIPGCKHETVYQAPWVRSFAAEHTHRLRVPSKNCWTLVIVLKATREWGFWHEHRWIHWRSYVKGEDSAIADKMKACD